MSFSTRHAFALVLVLTAACQDNQSTCPPKVICRAGENYCRCDSLPVQANERIVASCHAQDFGGRGVCCDSVQGGSHVCTCSPFACSASNHEVDVDSCEASEATTCQED